MGNTILVRRSAPKTHTREFITWMTGRYSVSVDGDIINHQTNKHMKHSIDRTGYHRVHLQINGRRISTGVHRLVALIHLPRPEMGDILGWEVNHIDCDKSNNSVENLEWVTHSRNMEHASSQKRMSKHYRKKHLRNEAVIDLYKLGWTPNRIAALFEISTPRVHKLLESVYA